MKAVVNWAGAPVDHGQNDPGKALGRIIFVVVVYVAAWVTIVSSLVAVVTGVPLWLSIFVGAPVVLWATAKYLKWIFS